VPAQHIMAVLIGGGEDRLADLLAGAGEEARRGGSLGSGHVEFVRRRKHRHAVRGLPRDGKAKQRQKPVPDFPLS